MSNISAEQLMTKLFSELDKTGTIEDFEKIFSKILTKKTENFLSSITIDNWINFDKNIGTEPMSIFGHMGQGKTNLANVLVINRFKANNTPIFFLPATMRTEWRHFLLYPNTVKKILYIEPDDVDIHYHNWHPDTIEKKFDVPFEHIRVDYSNFKINDYLHDDDERTIVAVYDHHFNKENLFQKVALWNRIHDDMLFRTRWVDESIGFLYNEAGTYFEEGAEGEFWREIRNYSRSFVDDRDNNISTIFISQLPSEIFHKIRCKAIWRLYKKGYVERGARKEVRDQAPFAARHQYHITYGGMFVLSNDFEPLNEIKSSWKTIPQSIPTKFPIQQKEKTNEEIRNMKIFYEYYKLNLNQDSISKKYDISQQRVSQILKQFDELLSENTNQQDP